MSSSIDGINREPPGLEPNPFSKRASWMIAEVGKIIPVNLTRIQGTDEYVIAKNDLIKPGTDPWFMMTAILRIRGSKAQIALNIVTNGIGWYYSNLYSTQFNTTKTKMAIDGQLRTVRQDHIKSAEYRAAKRKRWPQGVDHGGNYRFTLLGGQGIVQKAIMELFL